MSHTWIKHNVAPSVLMEEVRRSKYHQRWIVQTTQKLKGLECSSLATISVSSVTSSPKLQMALAEQQQIAFAKYTFFINMQSYI